MNRTEQAGYRNRQADPSPEEIAEEAAVIRAGWSDEERNRRAGRVEGVPLRTMHYDGRSKVFRPV